MSETEPRGSRLFHPDLFPQRLPEVVRALELQCDRPKPEASSFSSVFSTSRKRGAPAVFPSHQSDLRGFPVLKEWGRHP